MNMTEAIKLNFDQPPPLFKPYIKGFLARRKGMKDRDDFPKIQTTWKNLTISEKHLKQYKDICELNSQQLPFEYPLTLLFPSHMHILGHSLFPLSPFSMLQSRVQVFQHKALELNTNYTLHCHICKREDTAKGINLEMQSQFSLGTEIVWESINTYFFRNAYSANSKGVSFQKKLYGELPEKHEVQTFVIPNKKGFSFAKLSGDLNGIHYVSAYARLFGFKRALCHAQRSIAICLDRLPALQKIEQIQLDVALKGPAYYGKELQMKSGTNQDRTRIDLLCVNNPKPVLVFEIIDCRN